MAKKEKRHTNHSCYFAAPVLLLAFALQGFLPIVTALSASDPLTEIQTQSRQQQQIRELRQTGATPTIAARSAAKQPSARARV